MIMQLHITIEGEVQGVGFRWFVQRAALHLSLTGSVRNCSDGTVEVIAYGEKSSLEQLLNLCRKGPPFSRVSKVIMRWSEATDIPPQFIIR
ncbi:MAG: acylphosphatase [Patescibacteria group bacterium]